MLLVHMLKKNDERFVQIFLLVVIGITQFYILVLLGGFYIHVFWPKTNTNQNKYNYKNKIR